MKLYAAWWSVSGKAHDQKVCKTQREAEQFILEGLVDCLNLCGVTYDGDIETVPPGETLPERRMTDDELWFEVAIMSEFETINYDWGETEVCEEMKLYAAWWSVSGKGHNQKVCKTQYEAEQFILKGLVETLDILSEYIDEYDTGEQYRVVVPDEELWDEIALASEYETVNYDWGETEV